MTDPAGDYVGGRRSFESVLASRRMCRDFAPRPVPTEVLDVVLAAFVRGPAAGNTAALELLVLSGDAVERYWSTTLTPERRERFPWPGLLHAPVLVVPYVDPSSYVRRYSEPDKAHTGLGSDASSWDVPYWWVDGGAGVMAALLAAEDVGLGALFFGQFDHEADVSATFGVPAGLRALGTFALGYRAPRHDSASASSRRGRPELAAIRHDQSW